MNWIHFSGPLVLVFELAAIGALAGWLAAEAIRPWREQVAEELGTFQKRLGNVGLTALLGVAGTGAALLHCAAAQLRRVPVGALPLAPALVGGGLGVALVVIAALVDGRRPALDRRRRPQVTRRAPRPGQSPRPEGRRGQEVTARPFLSRREAVIAAAVGALIATAVGACAASGPRLPVLIAAAPVGSVLAQSWLLVRVPARMVVRALTGSRLRPAPAGFGAIALVGAGAGVAAAAALLTARVPAPPGRLVGPAGLAAVGALTTLWTPLRRYTALPNPTITQETVVVVVQGQVVARYRTILTRLAARHRSEGPPVFCIQGLGDNPAAPWLKPFRAIARRSGRELIAVALPELALGTDWLASGRKLPQQVAFVEAAIGMFSPNASRDDPPQPVLLVGSSLGGLVTLTEAHKPDAPIVGWCTIGTLGFEVSTLLWFVARRVLARPVEVVAPFVPKFVRRPIAVYFRRRSNEFVSEAELAALRLEIGDRRELERIVRHGSRMVWEAVNQRVDPRNLVWPGFAIWGSEDPLSRASSGAWLTRRRPDITVKVVEGEAHSFHMNQPELFAEMLVKSLVYRLGLAPHPFRAALARLRPGRARAPRTMSARPAANA